MRIRNSTKNIIFIAFILVSGVLLSGCVISENKVTPTPTTIPTPIITPIETEITEITPTETSGLTYEEQLRTTPPAPRNLVGEFKTNYIYLKWYIPESVTVPHNYSDIISYYKIYKGTTEEDMRYLTNTSGLEFKDFNVLPGLQYVYEITAVHKGGTEGIPTQDILVKT